MPVARRKPTLRTEKLSFTYPGKSRPVLTDVDFSAYPGDRIALVGPSGCGKTTLLRLLEGSLESNGSVVERAGKTALIYQDLRLVDEATALENVYMGMLSGTHPLQGLIGFNQEARKRALELLDEVGLRHFADSRVSTLSGGQKQRVAIARALASAPDVLLADEPFANLDPLTADRVGALLTLLQKKHGFTLICSVHDPSKVPGLFTEVREVCSLSCKTCPLNMIGSAASPTRFGIRPWQVAVALVAMFLWFSLTLFQNAPSLPDAIREGARFLGNLIPWPPSVLLGVPWAHLLAELWATLQMAFVGTFIGALVSLPLSMAASLPGKAGPLTFLARSIANGIRAMPPLLWALIFVAVLGIGPAAGVVALAAYSTGYLTRLFTEELENADQKAAMALSQLGASRLQALVQAILRPSAPGIAGATFFVFEYNVRAATVLGIVGAGGIGASLLYYIEWRQFPELFAALALIVLVVCLLDGASRQLRRRLALARTQ
jgi:phosphonate transport system permease protein